MNAQEVLTKAHGYVATMGNKPDEGVTSLSRSENGWTVCVEELERKGIPDTMDILGLYEINMNDAGDLVSVERKSLRKRGDTLNSG
jgi:hypothetical protein